MAPLTTLVVGATRGLGAALVGKLVSGNAKVYATARSSPKEYVEFGLSKALI